MSRTKLRYRMECFWFFCLLFLVTSGFAPVDTTTDMDGDRVKRVASLAIQNAVNTSISTAFDEYLEHLNKTDGLDQNATSGIGCIHYQRWFSATKNAAREIGNNATVFLLVIENLMKQTNMTVSALAQSTEIVEEIKTQMPVGYCGCSEIVCDANATYRTADGSCNNLDNTMWGMAMAPQRRYLPSVYEDGLAAPRRVSANMMDNLPSPRMVSNIVHKQNGESVNHANFSVMVMQWGQFIDHDVVATPVHTGKTGEAISCCGSQPRPECFTIDVPADDQFFNDTCMNFVRSSPAMFFDCIPKPREQLNQITSYIDGSAVYGSSSAQQASLRLHVSGLLVTGKEDLLPPNNKLNCNEEFEGDYCQAAGDARSNVVPSLGTSHAIFMREHNRLAFRLRELQPQWDDEKLFQEAKKIVSAEMQHITYNEYLPLILNKDYMDAYGLKTSPLGFNTSYDETVDATQSNVFGVAAFRFGHSEVPNHQALLQPDWTSQTNHSIETTYHRPHLVQADNNDGEEGVNGIARWLVNERTPDTDRFMEVGVRDLLFKDGTGISLDLAALNIQRGREHAIPPYNAWREFCGLPKATHFESTAGGLVDHTPEVAMLFSEAYTHPDDIDLFSGGVAEEHIEYGHVGPTFACLLAKQFQAMKQGDRFFYENDFYHIGFTEDQLQEIKKITLSKVLCENLNIFTIQPNSFLVPSEGNERVKCDTIDDIDLLKWIDPEDHYSGATQVPAAKTSSMSARPIVIILLFLLAFFL